MGCINLTNVCAGAGLGGNPYRDGSYNYYIHEPTRTNDFKGYGPLLLASLELEKGKIVKFKNKRVGLDYYYNNEYKNNKRYHYIWEDQENSGFSELGNIIKRFGADIDSIVTAPTAKILNKNDIYIIVDPDTPDESPKPNFIEAAAIKEIKAWVKKVESCYFWLMIVLIVNLLILINWEMNSVFISMGIVKIGLLGKIMTWVPLIIFRIIPYSRMLKKYT